MGDGIGITKTAQQQAPCYKDEKFKSVFAMLLHNIMTAKYTNNYNAIKKAFPNRKAFKIIGAQFIAYQKLSGFFQSCVPALTIWVFRQGEYNLILRLQQSPAAPF